MPAKLKPSNQRGYNEAHKRERRRYERLIAQGHTFVCARASQGDCTHPHEVITLGVRWDLGHTEDRAAWTGPEHTDCNRRAGGRNGAAKVNGTRTTPSRAGLHLEL